jgi:hypothetical protein
MRTLTVLSLFFLLIISCANIKHENLLIDSEGTYYNSDKSLKLHIYIENNFVRYMLQDKRGKELVRFNENISAFQKWGFYLDNNDTLWVFSSDIGNSFWVKDKKGNTYSEVIMDHLYDDKKVPQEIFKETRQFFSRH